jgi:hypothetical protein
MTVPRKPLTGILGDGRDDDGFDVFSVAAAGELEPLPRGSYVCVAESGRPTVAATGTRGYEITLRVIEGPNAGRKLWKTIWITPKSAAMAHRDLLKFGITTREQLRQELPRERIVVRVARAELAVWMVLWRDTKPNGLAQTGQADIARRAGVSDRAVRDALRGLALKGLLRVVRRGRIGRGASVYRVRGVNPDRAG